MKLFSEALLAEMKVELEVIHNETEEPLLYAERAIKMLVPFLEKLKTQCIRYKFKTRSEEIEFFRELKPQLVSQLIYYNDIYNIELHKPLGSKKAIRKYYTAVLSKQNSFWADNLPFYRYYRSGNRYLDNKYFLRGQCPVELTLDSFYFQSDRSFSTSHDYKVAQILSNEMMVKFLEGEIEKSKKVNQNVTQFQKGQSWTGSKVALIELIYALHTEGVFNHGTSDLKEVTTHFEKTFNISLGQYHRTFLEIRARKSERTKFLSSLRNKLLTRMDKADEL